MAKLTLALACTAYFYNVRHFRLAWLGNVPATHAIVAGTA